MLQVSADSVTGITAGIIIGVAMGVLTGVVVGVATRITEGVAIVFEEISGEKNLLLLVSLLVPTMLLMSGSVSSAALFLIANRSCLMPW